MRSLFRALLLRLTGRPPVVVRIVPGKVRTGWCEPCSTSSRFEVDLYGWNDSLGSSAEPLASVTGCLTCDPSLVDDTVRAIGDACAGFTEDDPSD